MRFLKFYFIFVVFFSSCSKEEDVEKLTDSQNNGKILQSIVSQDWKGEIMDSVVLTFNSQSELQSVIQFVLKNDQLKMNKAYYFNHYNNGDSIVRFNTENKSSPEENFVFKNGFIEKFNDVLLFQGISVYDQVNILYDSVGNIYSYCDNNYNKVGNPCFMIPWGEFICVNKMVFEEGAYSMNYHQLAVLLHDLSLGNIIKFQFKSESFFKYPYKTYNRERISCKDVQINDQTFDYYNISYEISDGYIQRAGIDNFTWELRFYYSH